MLKKNIENKMKSNYFMNNNNIYILSMLGGVSILYFSYQYFNNCDKYNNNNNNNTISKKELEYSNIDKLILESKHKCYHILIDTIQEYKLNNNPNSYNFSEFMKQMWYQDYLIMIGQIKETNDIHKHRYRKWETMFNNII